MMQDENLISYSQLETQLIDSINQSLQNHVPSNATFLAERLLAERDTEEARTLLADCYMAENKHYKVVHILKDCKSEISRYKFALSCVKVNKFKEAEKALIGNLELGKSSKTFDIVPNGSYGLYLMGILTEKQQRYSDAKEYFLKALEVNPTLWSAYEKLGKLGETIMPNKIFTEARMKNYENVNIKKQQIGSTIGSPSLTFSLANKRKKEEQDKLKKTTQNQFPKRKNSFHDKSEPTFPNLMTMLKKFADGHYNLCQYNCTEAIEQFKKLPQRHLNTGWVLTSIGRAFMEIVKYSQAAQYYQQAYKIEPHRLEGIEYYSSCLWHLKKQVELCYLAHQALQKSMYVSQAWIAVGNCFSLQKQHEQALKFFTRAIQLNPQNPYAYSLCGHEHVYNEDFAKAKRMFEQALNFDVRHYSAWWGLGNISYKQQKYDKAAESFHKAIGINPKNPVLYSFMGMTLAANRQFGEALKFFEKSENLDPKNGLNRFQKANTLVKLDKYEEAVEQLSRLQSIMPKEPPIPLLLGRIYRKLGNTQKAHEYFNLALDLESKDAQKIKGFIESLHNTGNEGDEMDF